MEKFVGKWKLTKAENHEGILDGHGLPEEQIKMMKELKYELDYSIQGDKFHIKFSAGPQLSREVTFKPGEEFESAGFFGTPVKSTVTFEGGKMIEKHHDPVKDMRAEMVRDIVDGKLVGTATVKGKTATFYHEKMG